MRYGFTKFLFLLVTGFVQQVAAQQYIFKNYTVNDGLVSNSIRKVFQDSKGFLWITTQEGISKYDGHRFTNFNTHNGLSHSYVNDFYESKDGRLLIACNDGSIDAIVDNKIIRQVIPQKIIVNSFIRFPGSKVIAITDNHGLQELANERLIQPQQSYPSITYSCLTWINDSLFIAASDEHIGIYNKNFECFTSHPEQAVNSLTGLGIYRDSKNRIWAYSYYGLKQLLIPSRKNDPLIIMPSPAPFFIPLLNEGPVTCMFEDTDGVFWIGTVKGVVKINTDGSHQVFTTKNGLVSDFISCIFQDREKNIWFGTFGGLSKLVTRSGIQLYTEQEGFSLNLPTIVFAFSKEKILTNSLNKLKLYNTVTHAFDPLPGLEKWQNVLKVTDSVLYLYVRNSMALFDIKTLQQKSVRSFYFPPDHFVSFCDADDNVFRSDAHALFFVNGKNTVPKTILDQRIPVMLADKKGSLWAGSWTNGLFRISYAVSGDSINVQEVKQLLPGEAIRSLYKDSKGDVWVGTRYNGLMRLREEGDNYSLRSFNQNNGLSSNRVNAITEDKDGNIWLGFYNGVDKLVRQDTGYRVFNFGRINNFFPLVSGIAPGLDNSLWLSTSLGLAHISIGEMQDLRPYPVYITNVSAPDSVYSLNEKKLNLHHRRDQLRFDFSSPCFINEKQVLYSYRLSSAGNNDWSPPSNEHSVSYASLRPGSYDFEVRSLGWNGEWGPVTSFSFTINPPFWQTWWFRAACVFVIVGFVTWLVRRRIKNIRREAAMKQKITETEMAALRSQMNPHFIFNCLNAIDNLIQTNQKDKATVYLSRFAKLVRNVLDSSKNNVVSFHKDYESLQLYLQMEQFRCNGRFEYQLTVDPELLNGDLRVPPLIVQPFVENAIHHGLLNKENNDRKLVVSACIDKDYIRYTITDNGIGREKARQLKEINKPEHRSYGIQITEERIHLYNQESRSANDVTITDLYKDNEPCGTSVMIRLKIADDK